MHQNGVAPIKAEFLIENRSFPEVDDDAAEGGSSLNIHPSPQEQTDEPPSKRPRLSGAQKKKLAREEKQKNKGANKGRRFAKIREDTDLCWKFADDGVCPNGSSCRFSHDVQAYLDDKPRDIFWSSSPDISVSEPFVLAQDGPPSDINKSINTITTCPNILRAGRCKYGVKCRFLGGHPSPSIPSDRSSAEALSSSGSDGPNGELSPEMNTLDSAILKQLRTRKYPTPIADTYVSFLESQNQNTDLTKNGESSEPAPVIVASRSADDTTEITLSSHHQDSPDTDTPDVPFRPSEKKRLHWAGKTYLAPLTTVGNLPFRRLCSSLGADITCSEMALATPLMSGSREEWSLVRRHPSESIFGVQVAGNKASLLSRTAEVLAKEIGSGNAAGIDFVDVNCGCPIDLIFQSGAGAALMDAPTKLGKILIGMNRALGEIPLTIKVRTGVKDGRNTAHKLVPRLKDWGVSSLTIHGRTRQQRYTKLADWDYIKSCVNTLRDEVADEAIPIFGGGDVYSSQAYWENIENYGVDGIMIGRGALIKPWIFTEIKERREWDISSRERLEMIRQLAEFGLNHWGSDTVGVNTTRRYLCESLSFQHRYVPIGLLEAMPGRINDRPPAFRGRDELETLLASPKSSDWVRISEMFLGPTPDAWNFIPKHKSNATEESNG